MQITFKFSHIVSSWYPGSQIKWRHRSTFLSWSERGTLFAPSPSQWRINGLDSSRGSSTVQLAEDPWNSAVDLCLPYDFSGCALLTYIRRDITITFQMWAGIVLVWAPRMRFRCPASHICTAAQYPVRRRRPPLCRAGQTAAVRRSVVLAKPPQSAALPCWPNRRSQLSLLGPQHAGQFFFEPYQGNECCWDLINLWIKQIGGGGDGRMAACNQSSTRFSLVHKFCRWVVITI